MVLVCLSVMMTTGLVTVNAQTPISYGVKAEANMSNFLLSDLDNLSSTMKLGPTLIPARAGGSVNALKDDASMRTQTVSLGIGYRF